MQKDEQNSQLTKCLIAQRVLSMKKRSYEKPYTSSRTCKYITISVQLYEFFRTRQRAEELRKEKVGQERGVKQNE